MKSASSPRIILAFAAAILYTVFAVFPAGRELMLQPRWSLGAPDGATTNSAASSVPFRLEDRAGFVNPDTGAISAVHPFSYNVALSELGMIPYDAVSRSLTVFSPSGSELISFEVRGYPWFDHERLFILRTDRSGIQELDRDAGETLWDWNFPSIITCVSANDTLCLVGLLNGEVQVINREGERVFSYRTTGSRISVVRGCAVSDDGKRIALVSGTDPVVFSLLERTANGYRELRSRNLDYDLRSEALVSFVHGDSTIALRGENGSFVFIDAKRGGERNFDLGGEILTFNPNIWKGLSAQITAGEDGVLALVDPERGVFASWPLPNTVPYLLQSDFHLVIGIDDRLVGLDLAVQ